MPCSHAAAQSHERSDLARQVKAAYLYKFGNYVEWPERALAAGDGNILIGVLGSGELADELSKVVAGRAINGHQIVVHKLRPGDPLNGMHIVFIANGSNDRLGEILAGLKGQPVLTVTESDSGLAMGSMINFVVVGGRLRFEVAPKAAQHGSLNISARLLAAALRVSP